MYIKAENLSLDMPESSIFPASFYACGFKAESARFPHRPDLPLHSGNMPPDRDGLQREHFTPLLQPDGNAVAHRTAQYLLHGVFVTLQIQVTVFIIALQDSFPFQKSSNTVSDCMHQLRQFLLIRCVGTMKATFTPKRGCVNTIQKQHVKGERSF